MSPFQKILLAAITALSMVSSAMAVTVQQSGTPTPNHVPAWVTNGIIGDGGTSADSPISSIGVTNNGGSGICVNSARQTSAGYNALCLGASTSGPATISLQNYGTASPETLQFVINGVTFPFPGSLANITIGTTPVVGGANSLCLFVSGGVVGQQVCTLSAITSLTGDVTATGPGVSTATLATVNSNVGTFTNPIITVNGKGLITSVSTGTTTLTVGSTTIVSGTTNGLLYANGSVLGNLATLANGVLVTSSGGVPSISTTLPSALTIPSPTFTGTETFPDAATWTASGISKVAALSVGSATIPSAGNISISGQYQVNGTQIAAANLSDGNTGTGAIVHAAAAAISGTWTGSPTFSGNITFSGQMISTGTSAPASAGGQVYMMGTMAAPTLANTGQGAIYDTLVNGLILQGDGSTNDVSLFNKSGTLVFGIPTGTTKLNFPSLVSGTCSGGLALDSGNNLILDSCPGAAASIQVGTTTITSGTNGSCLYSNAGTLGNHPCISEAQGRLTLTANTPVMTATASAQTTLRYDCYMGGGQVPYFDGTQDNIDTIASCEVTDAMVSAASAGQVVLNNVYDVWWVHSGANRICLAMSASTGGGGGWSADSGSNTARGTGFSVLDRTTRSYTTNKNALTNCFNGATNYGSVPANQATYLGTVYSSANGQISYTFGASASGGTAALFGVWNMYNRVTTTTTVTDTGSDYTYTTATIREARGSTGNQISFVVGIQEDGVIAGFSAAFRDIATSAEVSVAFGFDTTSAFSSSAVAWAPGVGTTADIQMGSSATWNVGVGIHTLSKNELGDGTNANIFDRFAGNGTTGPGSPDTLTATIRN
jgi:hypothetical protein